MNVVALKQRVQARDRLVASAEAAGIELHQAALAALARGDTAAAEAAILRNDDNMRTLVENLSIYQAELHAQAAELDAGHLRVEQLLTRFSVLFENMPVATLLVDASGVLLEANGRANALFALQQPRASPRFLHRMVDTAHYQRLVRPAFQRASIDVVTMLGDVAFISEDGRRFIGDLHFAALPVPPGQPAQYAATVIDRTEHVSAQRASEAAHRRIQELVEQLGLAIDAGGIGTWRWDVDGQDLVGDERMRRLAGQPVGTGGSDCGLAATLAAGEWPRLLIALQAAQRDGVPLDLDVQLSGEPPRHLHLIGRGHQGEGRARDVVGCARDCTAERQGRRAEVAREAAEAANRAKSAFLSRMSHELRTPLNAILGFSQLMRLEADAGDLVVKPHRALLIETAARHLLELVNEVMDVSRIEAGRMEVQLVRFDLAPMVGECLPMVVGMAEAADVRLIDDVTGGTPLWVLADRLRLKEVLINLLSNAVKYNRRGGQVHVSAGPAEDGRHVELRVADTGKGLDATQLAALFEPFNRLGAERTSVEGTGMGLFVSKRFVDLMGATLSVQSTVQVGSTFVVTLPDAPG